LIHNQCLWFSNIRCFMWSNPAFLFLQESLVHKQLSLITKTSPNGPRWFTARESYSFEFSISALWDSLRDSVCYFFVFICAWSFDSHWTSSKVLEACKASKRHQRVWWSLRDLEWSVRRRRARRSCVISGERERVERDPSLVDSSTGTRPSRVEPR
jgi:hypothetical protein